MEPLNEKENAINANSENSSSSKFKIYLGILIAIIIILIAVIIIIAVKKKTKIVEKIIEKEVQPDQNIDWNVYGTITYNISYSSQGKIKNTFKENEENYNETIGNLNNGNDYDENERNNYNLFIPYYALKNVDENNGIILFIHGGSWIGGEKESFNLFCKMYAEMGYITATMGYTLLNGEYKDYNIYRIMDEITACIQSIVDKLKEKGFKEEKLTFAIAGYSAGAHLTLLYTYLMTNSPLEIKFAVNICGPASLEPKFFYKLAQFNDTLDNLYLPEIQKALDSKRIVRINENDYTLLRFMNFFTGQKYTEEDLKEMLLENNKINKNNTKYIEMFNFINNAFPVNIEDKNNLTTICFYGGNDDVVGVTQFAYLNEKAEKYGKNIIHIYSRYADHNFLNFETEDGINAMREMNYQINHLAKIYFK